MTPNVANVHYGGGQREQRSPWKRPLMWLYKVYVSCAPVNWPVKLLMTAAAALLLSEALSGTDDVKVDEQDILVYSAIYCGWAIFFLPDILLHFNSYVVGKLFWLFFRLFWAEVAVGMYLHFKGETDVLRRGLSLRPLLGPLYQWLEELVTSIRFVLIVGCLSASVVVNLFDRPEILIDFVEDEEDENDDYHSLKR